MFIVRLGLYVAKHGLEIFGSSELTASASQEADITDIVSSCLTIFLVLKHIFFITDLLNV